MKDPIVWSIGLAKFVFAGVIVFLFRSVTPLLGLPNFEPLMATQLAGAKAYGPWVAGIYGALSMAFLDFAMHAAGPWTLWTSLCYAAIGVAGGYWLKGKPNGWRQYVAASIAGTLFFDLVTGVIMPPLYGTPLATAFVGQIPFTLKHLVGNIGFAICAPWFCRRIIGNPSLELKLMFRSA